jgi:quinol-cytochrome oxidoreductase complex cytochrome b subunit
MGQLLQGGPDIGPDTLSRFYSLHMLIAPGAIFALIGLHLYLVVRLGVTSPPWSKEAAGTGPLNGAAGNGKATRAGLSRFRRGR